MKPQPRTPSRTTRPPFGLALSNASPTDIVGLALGEPRQPDAGVALVVTPNIEHIARLRHSRPMAKAYDNAEVIVCDGWPVHLYARACGMRVARVTGCELAATLMRRTSFPDWTRFFFVVDRAETAAELEAWARRKGLEGRVANFIPPFGFEHDETLCNELAGRIRSHGTTVLMMAVGAPRSEIFVDRFRTALPPCWAFCVGQAVKIELGMVRRAPRGWQMVGMEWLWRLGQEPRRLAGRYATASGGFLLALLEDQFRRPAARSRVSSNAAS
jgi:N-acetylglucosaminyldiphosphoundecaprenol N-acetyl-beta-D-mannosaminyltransferase